MAEIFYHGADGKDSFEALQFKFGPFTEVEGYQMLQEALNKADAVYHFANSSKIGDTVISMGYLNALVEGFRVRASITGQNLPPIVVVVSNLMSDVLAPIADTLGIELAVTKPDRSDSGVIEETNRFGPNIVALDFQKYKGGSLIGMIHPIKPRVSKVLGSNTEITTAYGLFGYAMSKYGFKDEASGMVRYAAFAEELLGLPLHAVDPVIAQPRIPLPPFADQINHRFRQKNRLPLDNNRNEVAVIVEASSKYKRYPFNRWIEVMQLMSAVHPELEYNIVYHPTSVLEMFKREMEFKYRLRSTGLAAKCAFVSGHLSELAVFLSTQKAVLSNDTGLAHIAGAQGTPTVAVWEPFSAFGTSEWRSTRNLQYVDLVSIRDFDYSAMGGSIGIEHTPPEYIADHVLQIL